MFEPEKTNPESLEAILRFGELINKYAGKNNALIYDAIEYIYHQLRLLRGEDGAYDDVALYQKLVELAGDVR